MPPALEPLVYFAAFITAPVVFLAVVSYIQFKGQASPKARMEPVDLESDPTLFASVAPAHRWAEASGFVWTGAYRFVAPGNPKVLMGAWTHGAEPTFFVLYILQGRAYIDILTRYERDRVLTTNGSTSGGLFPSRPGAYRQSFTNWSYDQLWDMHLAADAHLRGLFRFEPLRNPLPVDQDVLVSVKRISEWVRSIPLWYLRLWVWYFRRNRMANVPVVNQRLEPPPP